MIALEDGRNGVDFMVILFDCSSLFRNGRVESGIPTYSLSVFELLKQTEHRVIPFYSGLKTYGLETIVGPFLHLPLPNKLIQFLTLCGVPCDWLIGKYARWNGLTNDHSPMTNDVFDLFFTPNVSTFYRYFSDKVNVIGVVHDLSQMLFPELKPWKERWKYAGQYKTHVVEKLAFWNRKRKPIFERFDHFIAISEHTKRDLVEFMNIPESRITVIYPMLDIQTTNSAQQTKEILEKLDIQYPYLLFLGHVEPRKNVENLIRAFAFIKSQIKANNNANVRGIQLVVAGRRGYQFKRLLTLCQELDLKYVIARESDASTAIFKSAFGVKARNFITPPSWASLGHPSLGATPLILRGGCEPKIVSPSFAMTNHTDVIFTGHITDDEKYVLMQNAAVFVYPSLYEGFAYPCLEAMSRGTPVVTSPVSALPEVLGDAALYADPWRPESIAALVRVLLDDSELRSRLIEKGRDRVKKYQNREQCLREWSDFLKTIESRRVSK